MRPGRPETLAGFGPCSCAGCGVRRGPAVERGHRSSWLPVEVDLRAARAATSPAMRPQSRVRIPIDVEVRLRRQRQGRTSSGGSPLARTTRDWGAPKPGPAGASGKALFAERLAAVTQQAFRQRHPQVGWAPSKLVDLCVLSHPNRLVVAMRPYWTRIDPHSPGEWRRVAAFRLENSPHCATRVEGPATLRHSGGGASHIAPFGGGASHIAPLGWRRQPHCATRGEAPASHFAPLAALADASSDRLLHRDGTASRRQARGERDKGCLAASGGGSAPTRHHPWAGHCAGR